MRIGWLFSTKGTTMSHHPRLLSHQAQTRTGTEKGRLLVLVCRNASLPANALLRVHDSLFEPGGNDIVHD